MKISRTFSVLALSSLSLAVGAAACGGSDNSGGGSGNPGSSSGPAGTRPGTTPALAEAGAGGSTSSGGSTADGGSPYAGMSDTQCQGLGTTPCITCCADNHASAYLAFIEAVVSCECAVDGGTGVCQAQCSSEYCAGKNPTPGDACASCLAASLEVDAGGQCIGPVGSTCYSGGPCDAYLACANACQ